MMIIIIMETLFHYSLCLFTISLMKGNLQLTTCIDYKETEKKITCLKSKYLISLGLLHGLFLQQNI